MFNNWKAPQVVLGGLKSLQRAPYASLLERPRGIPFANVQVGIVELGGRSMAVPSHSPCSLIYPSRHLCIYPSIHNGVIACCHHPLCSSISTTFHHLSLIYPSWCSIHWLWCPIMFRHLILVFHHVPPINCGVPADCGKLCGELRLASSQWLWVFATGVGGGQAGGEEGWWLYL